MNGYVLADDLTGALEVGASFRHSGHDVVIGLDSSPIRRVGELEVISTETRNMSPDAARTRLSEVLRRQQTAGATLLFKKIDSTLRGPLAAEIAAILEMAKPPRLVLCPANPAVGRTVVDGQLRVKGVPLTDTEFRHDPIWPMRESRIAALLAGEVAGVGHLTLAELRGAQAADAFAAQGQKQNRVLVCDAETLEDLQRLVMVARTVHPETVFVGANGLGLVLAQQYAPTATLAPAALPRLASLLIVCGSRHPASHRQVEWLGRHRHVPIVTIDPTAAVADTAARLTTSLAGSAIVALRLTRETPLDPVSALASLAAIVSAVPPCDGYFFTGGETAFATCRALGGHRLRIDQVWENTLVAAQLEFPGPTRPRHIFTKPGGYGDDALLARWHGYVMK